MPTVPTYDNFQATPNTLPQARIGMPEIPDVAGQQAQQLAGVDKRHFRALMTASRLVGGPGPHRRKWLGCVAMATQWESNLHAMGMHQRHCCRWTAWHGLPRMSSMPRS